MRDFIYPQQIIIFWNKFSGVPRHPNLPRVSITTSVGVIQNVSENEVYSSGTSIFISVSMLHTVEILPKTFQTCICVLSKSSLFI